MKICIVTPDYPDKRYNVYSFVKQLVDEFANQGHICYVISPYAVLQKKGFCKTTSIYKTTKGYEVHVIRTNYLSVSTLKLGSSSLSEVLRSGALKRAFKLLPERPDAIYCHFWKSGLAAYSYAHHYNIPLFVASGESVIKNLFSCDTKYQSFYDYVSGVVCVSTKNKEESVQLGLTTADRCVVLPNSIDSDLFKKLDKKVCRDKLGISQDKFIIAFVGWFNERKGSLRVSKAIENINNPHIYSFFLGEGAESPKCQNILIQEKVSHDKLPIYLNAADLFVLPTRHEGCCNAIVEAMACGLPIISSDRPFNWDVLNKGNSMLIDPDDVDALSRAINKMYEDADLRKKLSNDVISKAKSLTIQNRASQIIQFINSKIS